MKLFRFYSICSAHIKKDKSCPRCEVGVTVFEPMQRFRTWNFNRTHHVVNGMWVKK